MKANRFLLFCLNLLLAGGALLSQQTIFKKVLPPIGSFGGQVGGLAQDQNGYVWIATYGGLYKYDGYRFKLYTNNPSDSNSLASTRLETIYADKEGFIWIALWIGGLDRLDPVTGKFTHFKPDPNDPGSLSDVEVRAILEDHEGNLWFGTHGGLDRFDRKTGKFQHFRHNPNDPHSLSSNIVRALYEDREGTLWVGTGSVYLGEGGETDDGGLNRFDRGTGKFTRYLHDPKDPHSLINNKVRAMLEDSKGNFWVGTAGDGLHTMDRKTGEFQRHLYDPAHPEKLSRPAVNEGAGDDHISFIAEDALQNIWIGTTENGLNKYNPNTQLTTHYGRNDNAVGFFHNSGWSFCKSRDGILWIGTYDGGLYRIDPYQKNIRHVSVPASPWGFYDDSTNGFWIGTDRGLFLQNAKTGALRRFVHDDNDPASLSSNVVFAVCRDDHKNLWIGTTAGLDRLDLRSNTFTRYSTNTNDTNNVGGIYTLKYVGNDSLWLGTDAGLILMNTQSGRIARFQNDREDTVNVSAKSVLSVLPEKLGDVWAGLFLQGGLDYLDHRTGKVRHFLNGVSVTSILRDTQGRLWLGTSDGLYESNDSNNAFKKFTFAETGTDITNVLSLQEDNKNNIWVSSFFGIFKIDELSNEAVKYGTNYGVNADKLNLLAGYKGPDGKIYFGDIDGYYVFSPDELTGNSTPPLIVFTNFSLNGKPVAPGRQSVLKSPIETTTNIFLHYNQNVFSIDFAGIHYSDPENNQHLYMLENYDQVWHQAGAERTASYFNVPAGHYIFHVKASSSDGVWAEKSISIIISPPWWRSWWAYSIYALLFIVAAVTVHRFQKQRVIRTERERTRARELAQAKEIEKAYHELRTTQAQLIQSEKMASLGELTAGIAHEIQNPLNFVNNFSEVNRELLGEMVDEVEKGNTEEVRSLASNIIDNEEKIIYHGKRADAIVKSMLQHSRVSTGQKESTDINELADEYLRLSFHGMRAKDKSFNVSLQTNFDKDVGEVNVVRQDIGRVLINLFNNAFYAVSQKLKAHGSKLDADDSAYVPTVTVSTKKLDARPDDPLGRGKILISVTDNGPGIPQKVIDKIYQPFFTTKPAGQGTGLGLSLSYDVITKEHGGQIRVNTQEGEYTEFVIELPA